MSTRARRAVALLLLTPFFAVALADEAAFRAALAERGPAGVAAQRAFEQRASAGPESAALDALAALDATFAAALRAFDEEDYAAAAARAAEAGTADDALVRVGARYLAARVHIARNDDEPARATLDALRADPALAETPLAARVALLLAHAHAATLRFEDALAALPAGAVAGPHADAARQLRLEIERRELGTLGEVGEKMDYAAARLATADGSQRVREQQQRAVDLLDKLIDAAKQREQQQKQQNAQKRRSKGSQQQQQNQRAPDPRDISEVAKGAPSMNLHGAPKADPGEMWGKLPPAERERILDALSAKFPSRYRQLVEQYYRSLAEQK